MSKTDDYEPAIGGEMEPELRMGETEPAADGGEDDYEPVIGEASGQVQTRGRVISEKTREAFRKAQGAIRQQLRAEEGGSEFGEYEEGYTPRDSGTPAAAAGTPAPPAGVAPIAQAPAAGAVPPPELEAERQRIELQRSELEQRERQLAEREQRADVEALRDAYFERGAPALVDMIKGWIGATDDASVLDEVADLVTELSTSVLGAPLDPAIKARIEAKRATKGVKAQMAKLTARERAVQEQQEALAKQRERQQTEEMLQQAITAPDHAKSYPFLAAEDNAGTLIYDAVARHYARTKQVLPWTEAAKTVNEYLEKKWRGAYDRRAHLFGTSAGQTQQQQRPPGDPQGIRRSHSLSNGAASQPATPPPDRRPPIVNNGRIDMEAHRAATKSKMRSAFRPRSDE